MHRASNIAKSQTNLFGRRLTPPLGGWGVLMLLLLVALPSIAQKRRYVQLNSVHALSVPENPDYKFEWHIAYGFGNVLNVTSNTNVTHNIVWDQLTTYHVTVMPILDSVGCYGEPVTLDVVVVEYLSLHAFDDIYYTDVNLPIAANVGDNDLDETGARIFYNPTPVSGPQHGTLELQPDGSFTYTPNTGFTGTDYFVYEAYNDHEVPMYTNALVTIVVQPSSQQADLTISKTGPEKALFGEEITYTLVVRNNGPNVARNVMVKDTLAFGLFTPEYTMGSQPQNWIDTLRVGNIQPGDSVVVYLSADISQFSPHWIYNEALTYAETYDPNPSDNYSIWRTEVLSIYVDLPDQIFVPSCDVKILPGDKSNGNFDIAGYEWIPATGLDDPFSANPLFTPDSTTIGKTTPYILRITDINGNVAIDTTWIVVPDIPVAIISGDTLFRDLDENIMIYGNESIGDGLDYLWWTNNGSIISALNADSIEIAELGWYYLRISDRLGCQSIDSVLVLLESYPPVALNDSVAIQAASDSTINVLLNDSDINGFDLHVAGILTEPGHSTYTWDSLGNFTIRPDSLFWGVDSIEYQVCNNGYPVRCSSAWIIIDALRPPLNADVEIMKTGNEIAFFTDTIFYDLTIWSNGPDTATYVTVTDRMPDGLLLPQFTIDGGQTWRTWTGTYIYADSLRPGEDVIRLSIRALVSRSIQTRYLENMAYVQTEIIENVLENDTTRWISKIKEPVIANAGPDITVGSCEIAVQLDGTKSSGENLSYLWSPATYLDDPSSPTPEFRVGTTTTYTLTITDDDGITSQDQVLVTVLPPPLAHAGPDRFIRVGGTVTLDGTLSSPANALEYLWETTNGRFVGQVEGRRAEADTIGLYTLTVTDVAGCTDTDEVEVYPFYYLPFAIPDYYSTNLGTPISGNVLENDFEPNGMFNLSVEPGTFQSKNGGWIVLNADGTFTYSPPAGFNNNIDYFTYNVCNDAVPPRCSRGYVSVTVNMPSRPANLTIVKEAVRGTALIGYRDGVEFLITITNTGTENAAGVMIIDSLSQYLENARYEYHATSSSNPSATGTWNGSYTVGNLNIGQSVQLRIFATARSNAPDIVFNAATVASRTFDPEFNWFDVENRNVDTCSVRIESDLLAVAELVERVDNRPNDFTIGFCDNYSYLTGENSQSILGFDYFEWSHRELLTYPDSIRTGFTHALSDTTIVFTLRVGVGDRTETANITVHFSPEVIANAGPDRKLNPGQPLVIDGTNTQGAGATYQWYRGAAAYTTFENGNRLKPIVYEPGMYTLVVNDMHGCSDIDTVYVRENDLFVVSDFIVLLANDTLVANVRTNDYDPNLDSIYYTGIVFTGPFNGHLLDNPPVGGFKSALLDSNKIASDGTFIYVPNKDYLGYDYFQYDVCDDNDPDLCIRGTVFIKVIAVNHVNSTPLANADYLFVNVNDTLRTNLLANDYDFDGGQIHMESIVRLPKKGTVQFTDNGDFVYIPYPGQTGIDELTYEICDNGIPVKCDTARVIINIHKISDENHRPVAVDDAFFAVEKAITGNLMLNDYDPDGDELEILVEPVSGPYRGSIQMTDRYGSFIYVPNAGFEGTDQFVYALVETRTYEQYVSYATVYITSIAEERYITDVEIVKTGPAAILSGQTIEYRLKTNIIGPSLSNDLVVSDTLFSALTNHRFSIDGGTTWRSWNIMSGFEQMMLYADSMILIRADIPMRFEGTLVNTAWVNHDMGEKNPANNRSRISTEVYQSVIADAGADVVLGACTTSYTLDAGNSVGMSNLQFEWFPSELLDNPNSSRPVFTTEPGETREFMLVVRSSFAGFTDSDTAYVRVSVAEKPIAIAGEDIWPDDNEPVEIDGSLSTGAGPLQYLWWTYDRDGNQIELATTPRMTVDRSGDYYLTITDIHGCTNTDLMHVGYPIDPFDAIDDIIVTYQQLPVDIYVLRNDIIDEDDRYNLELLLITEMPKHGQLIQLPFDSMFTYIPDPYYSGYDTFTYVATTLSYTDQAKVFIQVLERRPKVPEGFSPNGDGINDVLIIPHIELYENNSLLVFNRWGNIVYQKEKYDNADPWNGVANKGIRVGGGALPAGVYYYILDLGPDERIIDRFVNGNMYIATDNRR